MNVVDTLFVILKVTCARAKYGNKFKYLLMSLGSMNEKSINMKKKYKYKKGDKNLTFIIGQYI